MAISLDSQCTAMRRSRAPLTDLLLRAAGYRTWALGEWSEPVKWHTNWAQFPGKWPKGSFCRRNPHVVGSQNFGVVDFRLDIDALETSFFLGSRQEDQVILIVESLL